MGLSDEYLIYRALQSRLRFSTIDKSEDRTSNIGNLYSCFAIQSLIVQQFRLCCSTTENSEDFGLVCVFIKNLNAWSLRNTAVTTSVNVFSYAQKI
nr:hypothetical protein CFP56_29516 [Quercus suber]